MGRRIRTAVTTSDGCSTVIPGPRIKSARGMLRQPDGLEISMVAPNTTNGGTLSPAGEAVQIFPAKVAPWRTGGDANVSIARNSAENSVFTVSHSSKRCNVTAAPIVISVSEIVTSPNSSIRSRANNAGGVFAVWRSFTNKSVPPASIRPSGYSCRKPWSSANVWGNSTCIIISPC